MMHLALLLLAIAALGAAEDWRVFTPRFASLPSIANEYERSLVITDTPDSAPYEDKIGYGYLTGPAFPARLLRIQGLENERSLKYAILEMPGGEIRGWPVRSFSSNDQQYFSEFENLQESSIDSSYTPFDGLDVPYFENYEFYSADDPNVETYATDHFLFYWGKFDASASLSGTDWYTESFRTMNYEYFEQVWTFYAKTLNVTMPWASPETSEGPVRHKINVFVTGTGLSQHEEGFAFAAEAIIIHPGAMLEGSSVIPHEFGHVLQFYSKGFRNSEYVGWFWECHADWISHQFIPSYPPAMEVYLRRKTHELSSTRMNYGSWLFLQVITEDPRFPSSFTTDIWKNNLKNEDTSTLETPFETITRLGVEVGVFKKENGTEEFGDLIGLVASKMAYFDLVFQQTYKDFITRIRGSDQVYMLNTPVEPVPDRESWYRPWISHQPWQYGVNIIPLDLDSPRNSHLVVQLNFLLPEGHADWRASLAVEASDGSIRYSSKFICHQCSTSQATTAYAEGYEKILYVDVKGDDKSAFLTVSASPKVMERLGFRAGLHRKNGYPYEFKILRGATVSESAPTWSPRAETRPDGSAHPNGGGFVASSAQVASTAYVGPNALVLGNARVYDRARIEDYAIVSDEVKVYDDSVISGHAWVNGLVEVHETAKIRDFSRVHGEVIVSGDASIYGQSIVAGKGVFGGRAVSMDLSAVVLIDDGVVSGSAMITRDAEFYSATLPTDKGRYYDFSAEDNNYPERPNLPESSLFADFSFNLQRGVIMKDEYSSNDGFIRGAANFSTLEDRTCLYFPKSGEPAYAVLPAYLLDSNEFTFDVIFKHLETLSSDSVLASLFTEDEKTGFEFGLKSNGQLKFTFKSSGTTTEILSTETATNTSRWYNIRFEGQSSCDSTKCTWTVSSYSGTYELQLSQSSVEMTRESYSEFSKISSGLLGKSSLSDARFFGWIDHFRVHRKVYGTTSPPSPPGADGTDLTLLNYGIENSQRNTPSSPKSLDALLLGQNDDPVLIVIIVVSGLVGSAAVIGTGAFYLRKYFNKQGGKRFVFFSSKP